MGLHDNRPVIISLNEGTFNSTAVDLLDLIEFINEPRYFFVGGKFNGKTMSLCEILTISNGGFNENLSESRQRGVCCHRAELDNQPLVDGYLSPMWDGGRIRYETQEIYNMLSN